MTRPITRLTIRPCSLRQCLWILGVSALLVQGCSRSHYRASATAGVPGLTEDNGRRAHRGTNPNAPFTLVSRPQLSAASTGPILSKTAYAKTSAAALTTAGPCSPDDLGVVEVAEQVNGSERFVSLAFVNGGQSACTIGGYPTLALLDEKGLPVVNLSVVQIADRSQIVPASAAISTPAALIELSLAPKAEAYFGISWLSGEECPAVSRLVIGAPGLTRSFSINHPLTVCSGQVRVTALRPTQNAA